MQERIKAFLDIAALVRARARSLEGGVTAGALKNLATDIEGHAGAMAEQPPVPTDTREALARDLYERAATRCAAAMGEKYVALSWERIDEYRAWWLALVDVIGEIERERHPLRVLTVAPGGSQTVNLPGHLMCPMCTSKGQAPERVVWGPEHGGIRAPWEPAPLTEAEARTWSALDCAAVYGPDVPPRDLLRRYAAGLLAADRREIPEGVRPKPDAPSGSFMGRGMVDPHGVLAQDLMRAHLRTEPRAVDPTKHPNGEDCGDPCQHCAAERAQRRAEHPRDEATALAYGTWDGDVGQNPKGEAP